MACPESHSGTAEELGWTQSPWALPRTVYDHSGWDHSSPAHRTKHLPDLSGSPGMVLLTYPKCQQGCSGASTSGASREDPSPFPQVESASLTASHVHARCRSVPFLLDRPPVMVMVPSRSIYGTPGCSMREPTYSLKNCRMAAFKMPFFTRETEAHRVK